MPKLEFWSERAGNGATIRLDSGEVVIVSIAQVGVLVRKWEKDAGFWKMLMSNFWGARLYNERSIYKNAKTAQALSELFPDKAPELPEFKNPVLAVFANAVWHCGSAAEVCTVLNEAAKDDGAPKKTVRTEKPKTVADVMAEYGALLEKYPAAVLDISMLPFPKTQMKTMLKGLYAQHTDPDLQRWIELGYVFLSRFQDGVGPVPIVCDLKATGTVPTKAELAKFDRWHQWEKLAFAEMEFLMAEWKRFKAGEPV
jgi:hypothetical protein